MVKWVSFLGSLHWPVERLDLGVGGISYVELLILYELWAGERLVLEKAHPWYLRPGRPISVSAVPFGPGIHVRERDKMLLRSIMVGGVWNGYLLGKVRGEVVLCRFCGGADGDGHLFWECPYPPLVEIRENPEFHDLMRMDESHWPRCLLWHGWLHLLSGTGDGSPWADSADDAAVYMLESALGSYSSDIPQGWDVPQSVDWDSASDRLPPSPDVWTDGSLVRDEVSGSCWCLCSLACCLLEVPAFGAF